jgi:hypothetical protein
MVSDHQSGWTYLLILGGLSIGGALLWLLGKLFSSKAHTAAGNALIRAEAIFNPSREHIIEAKSYEQKEG